ncbi:unnamed protein product, partial [Phaeothamnion confervicola]
LSGETAVGNFPIAAVTVMRGVADASFDHLHRRNLDGTRDDPASPAQGMIEAIGLVLRAVPITKVIAITRSGYAARMLSAHSVSQPILAISDDEAMARSFNILSGVEGYYINVPFPRGSADHIKGCIKHLYELGQLDRDDLLLITGVVYPRSGTRMNMMQIHKLSDLVQEFSWAQN